MKKYLALLAVVFVFTSCVPKRYLKQSQMQTAALREDSIRLSNNVSELQNNVSALQDTIASLQASINNLNAQNANLNSLNSQSKETLQQQQARLQQLQRFWPSKKSNLMRLKIK